MIDCSASWMEYAAMATKKPRDDAAMGRHVLQLDLILDVYIDPVTERHMNLSSPEKSDTHDVILQRVLRSFQSSAKAREPQPQNLRDALSKNPTSSVAQEKNGHSEVGKISSRNLLLNLERPLDANSTPLEHVRSKRSLRKFVAYPKEQEVELAGCARDLSQLLAAWAPVPQCSTAQIPAAPDEHPVADVEQSLFRCRFTSSGAVQKIPILPPRSLPNQTHPYHPPNPRMSPPEKTLMEIDAFSSDSSSMSSLSFPEHQQALPPALLRVSTSTILEEQDLIWMQIQQDRQKEESRRSIHHATWEVTRSHARPPLSPQSRPHSMHHASSSPKSTRSFPASLSGWTVPSEASSSPQRTTHPPEESPTRISLASTCSSSPRPVEPSKDRCLGCHASLTWSSAATVVYCAQCGTMASADLMRSLIASWTD